MKDTSPEKNRDLGDKIFLVCFIIKQFTSSSHCRSQMRMITLENKVDKGGGVGREKSCLFMCTCVSEIKLLYQRELD